MSATAHDLGRDHPNSPSFVQGDTDGLYYFVPELDLGRPIAETQEAALARIDKAMAPATLHYAGKRLRRAA